MNYYGDFLSRLIHSKAPSETISDLLLRVDVDNNTGQDKLHLAMQLSLAAAMFAYYKHTGADIAEAFHRLTERIISTMTSMAAELRRTEYEDKAGGVERYD